MVSGAQLYKHVGTNSSVLASGALVSGSFGFHFLRSVELLTVVLMEGKSMNQCEGMWKEAMVTEGPGQLQPLSWDIQPQPPGKFRFSCVFCVGLNLAC